MHPLTLCPDYNAPEYEEIRAADFFDALMREPGGPIWTNVVGHHGDAGDCTPPRPIRRQR